MNQNSLFKPITMIIVVIVIILAGAGYIWMAKSKSQPISSGNLHAKDVSDLGRDHLKESELGKVKYNSNPPTSGPHCCEPTLGGAGHDWVTKGIYDKPLADGKLVHSLEHGYIIISFNCEIQDDKEGTESAKKNSGCSDFINKLKDLVKKDSWKMILIPRPSLDTNFALTAWGKIDKFDLKEANLDRVNAFKEAFRNNGPEQTME